MDATSCGGMRTILRLPPVIDKGAGTSGLSTSMSTGIPGFTVLTRDIEAIQIPEAA